MKDSICPICMSRTKELIKGGGDHLVVPCPRCGCYNIRSDALEDIENIADDDLASRARISHFIRRRTSADRRFMVTAAAVAEARSHPLPAMPNQIDGLVAYIARKLGDDTQGSVSVDAFDAAGIVGLLKTADLTGMIDAAVAKGWLVRGHRNDEYGVTLDGWERVQKRTSPGQGETAPQVTSAFPLEKNLLHPSIADEVYRHLSNGDHQAAAGRAFRAVEQAVREVAGFGSHDHGIDMIRRAFNVQNGPLRAIDRPPAEREGMFALFTGAFGYHRNPLAHRDMDIGQLEAIEMVMLASHLLRIVDARRAPRDANAEGET